MEDRNPEKITEEVVAVAMVDVPEYTGLDKEIVLNTINGWDGHMYGQLVGREFADGKVESFFVRDQEKLDAPIYNKLKKDVRLIKKNRTVMNHKENKLLNVVDYFIPYKVKNHCSELPTIINNYVDGCMNIEYYITYEIVLAAGEGYVKYITVDYKTKGTYSSSFHDQIEVLESTFEEMFDNKVDGFKNHKNYKTVAFYDEVGELLDVEINSINKLLNMITSLRVIRHDRKIVD